MIGSRAGACDYVFAHGPAWHLLLQWAIGRTIGDYHLVDSTGAPLSPGWRILPRIGASSYRTGASQVVIRTPLGAAQQSRPYLAASIIRRKPRL